MPIPGILNEELLSYIWQHRLYSFSELKTNTGETVEVVHCGLRNRDAGPDFSQAKIRLNGDLLAGNVELHLRSSDWFKHQHQRDKAYSNLILHVVFEDDSKIPVSNAFPTLELKDKIEPDFMKRYQQLMSNGSWIPCENQLHAVDEFVIKNGLHRLVAERLERKTEAIREVLAQTKNSWEETCYRLTARNFGLKINAEPFERLARSLPLNIIAKHKNNLFQLEALLFGQAGMLESDFTDEYPNQLKKEFGYLQKKYSLTPLPLHVWKFLRLRPPGFPTLRIAQFAALLFQSSHLFSKMLEAKDASEMAKLFQSEPSAYWQTHYLFDKPSAKRSKKVGNDFLHLLMINAVAPMLFLFGKTKGDVSVQEKAITLLEHTPYENNAITRKWKSAGVKADSAYESQALLQLKNEYCAGKKCLQCHIGNKVLTAE